MTKLARRRGLIWALLMTLALTGTAAASGQSERLLVGAYYYIWYPNNFRHGYLREKLRPVQDITLGQYSSQDPETARRHIAWASRYGIDFFAVDWWPTRPAQNQALSLGLLQAPNLGDIKFCIFHETWDLVFRPHDGHSVFGGEATERFREDIRNIAAAFFDHPNYLKIDGRPVIILYLTRTFSGLYAEAMDLMRRDLIAMGYNPYVIADEVYWEVISTSTDRLVEEPQPDRMRLFDALTAYNMHDEQLKDEHRGYAAGNSYLADVADKYREYYDAARALGIAFAPGVLPGFNDRGPRLGYDHFVTPRRMYHDAPEGSFYEQSIDQTVTPFLDPNLNMALITSWNEWNEDTSIEPVDVSPASSRDETSSMRFTQGFNYAGYGTAYLEITRDKFRAVHGRLARADGLPADGREVCAWNQDEMLECNRTDQEGWYTLSRLHLPPGEYQVGAVGGAESKPVTVLAERSARLDLVWPEAP